MFTYLFILVKILYLVLNICIFVQPTKMEGHGEMGLIQENFDPSMMVRMRNDGYESRSGSDNVEGASGDDQDAGDDQRPKKKYHRHTPRQIQELEAYDFASLCSA
jgi:hypothetical protein